MLTHGEQTRNESYQTEQPVLPNKRAAVLEFVRARGKGGATRQEIAAGLDWEINCVTGRVKELLASGELVETLTKRTGPSGKPNTVVCGAEFYGEAMEGQANDSESRIVAVIDFLTGENDAENGVKTKLILDYLERDCKTNKLWPAGTRMQWEDAIAAAVKRGLLVQRDSETVWLAAKPAAEEQEAPKVVQQTLF